MALQIRQTFGQIGIETQRAWMSIKQPAPKPHIEQKPPEVIIRRKLPKVYIDQTQCFAESGLKPPLQLARDFNQEGLKAIYEAIGRIAEEGTRMVRIEDEGNPIVDIAYEKAYKEYRFNMVQMPKSRSKIEWDIGYTKIDWEINPAKIEWELYTRAQIDLYPHKVNIYLKQWPHIEIRYVGENVDLSI